MEQRVEEMIKKLRSEGLTTSAEELEDALEIIRSYLEEEGKE
jgi:hypothetical protein